MTLEELMIDEQLPDWMREFLLSGKFESFLTFARLSHPRGNAVFSYDKDHNLVIQSNIK